MRCATERQFFTNIEIGNMTLGAAATNHSKDALDGAEFGQFSSYATRIKWVTPTGELAEADESHPELLRKMRSSYGLTGVVYEVTFRIKPVEVLHFTYMPRPIEELTETEVNEILDNSEGVVCWTVGRTAVFQRRARVEDRRIVLSLFGAVRRRLWNHSGAHAAHFIDQLISDDKLRAAVQDHATNATELLYSTLRLFGGITLVAPDKTVDYSKTPQTARYAFTFWAFPRAQWLDTLRAYLDFADDHFKRTGFRCNMPLGAYFIRKDTGSLLGHARWRDFLHRSDSRQHRQRGVV